MVLWRLCAVTTPIPWGTSQLENYIRVAVSLTAFAESIPFITSHECSTRAPLSRLFHCRNLQKAFIRPEESDNNSGSHQQLCGRRSELIYATLPPGLVPPIKEINDPG
jgi:hypothetical protein